MEPINVNHAQILSTFSKSSPTQDTPKTPETKMFTSGSNSSPSVVVELSPAASQLAHDYTMTSRFTSLEEQSEHVTLLAATWVTQEELENGKRRPFASAEDERLSHLTLKELMEEGLQLPRVDKNGHLQTGFAGTEQGDRIGVAVANILLETQHNYRKAAKNVEASVEEFKKYMEEEFNIDPDSYDIIFRNGKITAISKRSDGINEVNLKKVQETLDNPEKIKAAEDLTQDIEAFNEAAAKVIDNSITPYIYGAQQNRYLPKEVSVDWLLEGMNYSHASTSGQINDKFLTIMTGAREKYHAALEDGTHLANGTTDPGILELTKMRQSQDQNK